jgi:aspartyl protease family protein
MNITSQDQQNIIYLLILLAFFAFSLFANRDLKISKILKYLAIWSFIAFIGVVLYAYRFEFSDFKNRILVEINPSKAVVNQGEEIIINISQDGHFYLDTKINNVQIRFMIDTGASDIVLNQDDAKKIGINLTRLNFNKRYETANGTVFGASLTLPEIEISGIIFKDVAVSINGGKLDVSLLGMDFLRNFKRYEFFQDKLILQL